MPRLPPIRTALLASLAVLAACGDGAAIVVNLQLGTPDPFAGVVIVRLEASGPDMQTLRAEASRSSGEVQLPPIPYGSGRRIVVAGLDGERFAISMGESATFEVTSAGPDSITVPFARCAQNLYRDDDGDGYGVTGPVRVGCAQSGWAPRGEDCDDKDADAHPGQTGFFTSPRKGAGGYDFNCDGRDEQQSAEALPTCDGLAPCKGEGWAGAVPACGQPGELGSCLKQGAACAASTQQKLQGCR